MCTTLKVLTYEKKSVRYAGDALGNKTDTRSCAHKRTFLQKERGNTQIKYVKEIIY